MKRKKSVIIVFAALTMLLFGMPGSLPASVYAQEPQVVESDEELRQAIEDADAPATIVVGADITLTDTLSIKSSQNITLIDDGEKRNISAKNGTFGDKDVICVEEGGSLTLSATSPEMLAIGGLNNYWRKKDHGVVHVKGTFTLDGAAIENCTLTGNYSAVVRVAGEQAVFNMKSGYIRNNTYTVSGLSVYSGTVLIREGGVMNFSGGAITNNKTEGTEKNRFITAGILVHSTQAGSATVNMSGDAEISNNSSTGPDSAGGGVYLLETNWSEGYHTANKAVLTMEGGRIADNTVEYAGGGVFVYGNAEFTMNAGTIKGNLVKNGMGGGVATYDYFSDVKSLTGQDDSYMPTWNQFVKAAFRMNGGSIINNKALGNVTTGDGGCGGGIYVASNDVELKAGRIANNEAARQGGGVYVGTTPYVLTLYDTLVTGNTADVIGGGIWLCPTGTAASSVENGGAVFGNSAKEAGDDIASIAKTGDATLSLTNRLLGNWLVHWYEDGAIDEQSGVLGDADATAARYSASSVQVGGIITGAKNNMALKAVSSEQGKEEARAQAKLEISGNSSLRGGGIGTNGTVIFNKYEVEYPTVDVSVAKKWEDTTEHPDKVVVSLYQDDRQIDRIELSEENGWEYVFKDLPKYQNNALDIDDDKTESVYTVAEEEISGFESEITTDNDSKYAFVIVNTPVKETGGETDDEPDDKPDAEPGGKPESPEEPSVSEAGSKTPDNPETGDAANTGFYASLLAASGLLIAVLAIWKKKKAVR